MTNWKKWMGGALLLLPLWAFAQDDSKLQLSGYIKYLHTVNYQDFNEEWMAESLFHNRLNFKYYPHENLTGYLEIRNRFFWGDFIESIPIYKQFIDQDNGFVDLSFNVADGRSYLFNSTIDRFYLEYNKDKWMIHLGRHRVNWGQNLVWNPNDVFNAFSFFDFDYEERPGTDALRVQYYTSSTSAAEFVYELGETIDDMSFMGLYRFSRWNYDIQFLGGLVKNDIVIGTGWSGDIEGAGFRGEITYFHPKNQLNESNGQLVASISGDYTFTNRLYVHGGVLYNSIGSTEKVGMPNPAILTGTSAKSLTLSRGSLFGQIGYPVTPLFRADLAAIVNPFDGSFFVGPSLTYSLMQNFEVLFTGQLFDGESGSEFGDVGKLWFMRMRYSF